MTTLVILDSSFFMARIVLLILMLKMIGLCARAHVRLAVVKEKQRFSGSNQYALPSQAAQTQYESLIINMVSLLRNPQKGREHKGFVWEFR